MLVLTRRVNQEIVIGDPANPIGRIHVTDIRGDRVRIGCDFPAGLPIHRREIADLINARELAATPARAELQTAP